MIGDQTCAELAIRPPETTNIQAPPPGECGTSEPAATGGINIDDPLANSASIESSHRKANDTEKHGQDGDQNVKPVATKDGDSPKNSVLDESQAAKKQVKNDDQSAEPDTATKPCDTPEEDSSPKGDNVADQDGESVADEDSSSTCSSECGDRDSWLKDQPKKVSVRWTNYEGFKNRFSQEEGLEIIEVLAGHPDGLSKEMLQEHLIRSNKRLASRRKHAAESEVKFIHRIRVQSPAILHILRGLTAQDDWAVDEPLTFMRPFETFYYSFPLVKQTLKALERLCAETPSHEEDLAVPFGSLRRRGTALHEVPVTPEDPVQQLSMPEDVDLEDVIFAIPKMDSDPKSNLMLALEHLQLFADFVEEHIVPMWLEARGSSKPKVRFWDLPMYFRPGDIWFDPAVTEEVKSKSRRAGSDGTKVGGRAAIQNYWKLTYSRLREPDSSYINHPQDFGDQMTDWVMELQSFHIDFDGEKLAPADSFININYYDGEKDIRTLPAYPLRFMTDEEEIRNRLTKRAKSFLSHIEDRHLYYDGWTLVHSTFSSGLDLTKAAEHIEGEIMVDFKEGFQSDADYTKPSFGSTTKPTSSRKLVTDGTADIQWWFDKSRSKKKGYFDDRILLSEGFEVEQHRRALKIDKVLKAYEDDGMVSAEDFDPDHLLLLPQRLIAYSFRARKYFVANVETVCKIETPQNPFKDLKVNSDHKRILKSLVKTHFQKQDIRRQHKGTNLDQDFIRGKGGGLVILLHGVPGVGKTTTAEAVALDNRKPLFSLTSGDLGSTPRDVENALRENFRLAAMWDCVLLLDEADLFLAKRDVGDLERNSLVSVFLRVLDYYDGVLFLTTNRVGTVDEAFRSRIHLSLYYPELKRKQTLSIFELNISRIEAIEKSKADIKAKAESGHSKLPSVEIDRNSIMTFATRYWDDTMKNPSRRWNGRQIRNAFQVAYSLSLMNQVSQPRYHEEDCDDDEEDYDGHSEEDEPDASSIQEKRPAKLDATQFEIVAQSIWRFDSYLDRTRGKDSDYAKIKNLRRDDYQPSDEEDSRGDRRYWGRRRPPSPHRGADRLGPPHEYGGSMRQGPGVEREQRSRGERKAYIRDDVDDDYGMDPPQRRRGPSPTASPRASQRRYNDDYGYQDRYR